MKYLPKEVRKGVFSMVPKLKMSKNARAELNKQQRVTWNFPRFPVLNHQLKFITAKERMLKNE